MPLSLVVQYLQFWPSPPGVVRALVIVTRPGYHPEPKTNEAAQETLAA